MKKSVIAIAIVAFTFVAAGYVTSAKVFAINSSGIKNPMSALVEKIAAKFNLNIADVQAVFDQDREDRQAEMEAKYEEKLAQYVKDGKLTEEQKSLILTKHKEIQANRQSKMQDFSSMTEEQRKAEMEAKKTEMAAERKALEEWATQNGIDIKYLMGGFGKEKHGGGAGGGPFGAGGPPPDAPKTIVQ